MIVLIGVFILFMKFLVDLIVKVPVVSNVIPFISVIGNANILYPVSMSLILYGLYPNKMFAAVAFVFIALFILIGGQTLI